MRLSAINALLFIALAAAGGVVGAAISRMAHLPYGTGNVLKGLCASIFVIVLSSPIYQRLHFLPLWLPRCPNCHNIPNAYHAVSGGWPCVSLGCGQCGQQMTVWLCRHAGAKETLTEMPVFCLRWPEFVGIWRRIS